MYTFPRIENPFSRKSNSFLRVTQFAPLMYTSWTCFLGLQFVSSVMYWKLWIAYTQWLRNLHYHDTSIHIIHSLDLCNAIRQNELCKLKERITNPREQVAQFVITIYLLKKPNNNPQQKPMLFQGQWGWLQLINKYS